MSLDVIDLDCEQCEQTTRHLFVTPVRSKRPGEDPRTELVYDCTVCGKQRLGEKYEGNISSSS